MATADQDGLEIRDRLALLAGAARLGYDAVRDGPPADAQANVGVEYTATEKSKLETIAANAQPNVGVEFTTADHDKLDTIETNAKDDQTGGEIVSAITAQLGSNTWQGAGGGTMTGINEVNTDSTITGDGNATPLSVANPYTQDDEDKLDGITAGAQPNVGVEFTTEDHDKPGWNHGRGKSKCGCGNIPRLKKPNWKTLRPVPSRMSVWNIPSLKKPSWKPSPKVPR